jgi:hypothetical protein
MNRVSQFQLLERHFTMLISQPFPGWRLGASAADGRPGAPRAASALCTKGTTYVLNNIVIFALRRQTAAVSHLALL